MLDAVASLLRRDLENQVFWAKEELRRSGRSAAVTAVLIIGATLAMIGVAVVGCMALYVWIEERHGAMAGFGGVGALLAASALVMLAVALWRPATVARPRPPMLSAHPETLKTALSDDIDAETERLIGVAKSSSVGPAILAGEEALRTGSTVYRTVRSQFRSGSVGSIVGSLAIVTIIGVVLGRRL